MALRSFSSSFDYRFSYDVFLSFRGTDTRYGFTGNLNKALRDKGIHTFFDDDELERGDEITPALVNAIEGSRIAIPILSKNYASSSFCLDELVHIIESVKAEGRLVLPVFLDVDPSHVRHQLGSYGEAMTKHEARFSNDNVNLERLHKWKMALNQVANLSGYHFKQGDEYEHVFIGKIIEEVSRKIKRVALPIADYPVGLEYQVLKVKSLLDLGSDENVNMVGIYGIGGIGKTTLALAVYNFIADHFDGLCFLENVRENSSKHGLMHLQKILLSEILGEKNIELASVRQGIATILHRLQGKKILLILDDVDKPEQLQAFVGRRNMFGPGSTIIITTRDKHLLDCHEIKKTYKVKKLKKGDALKLLQWKSSMTGEFSPCYLDVLNRAITYACGLPLALEVIGSNLFGKGVEEWKSALDQYERIPIKEIQRILKVSFDALEEEEQSVFLDIACCLKGYSVNEVEDILCAHYGNCMKYQIGVLIEKSLLKIGWFGDLSLHDLLEDMGKEIVRQESTKEAGERSRLWSSKDIVQVLEENSGTSKIEMICMNSCVLEKEEVVIKWNGEALKKMTKLTTLIIRKGRFSTGPKHFPNSLKVLEWWEYPSQNLPFDLPPKNLVICKLPNYCFASFELNGKYLNLQILNFNDCPYLTSIEDVSGLPNLEELKFARCWNLITIHSSVGFLDKLKILDAYDCKSLRSFPPMNLTSLENLDIRNCINLEAFPEIIGKMENITDLNLRDCISLKEIPFSIVNLTGLRVMVFCDQRRLRLPSSIVMMPKLTVFEAHELNELLLPNEAEGEQLTSSNIKYLGICRCHLPEISFSSLLMWFANIEELDLSFSDFTVIPECINEYLSLRTFIVNHCWRLQEIRGIPPKLEYFSAGNCRSLTSWGASILLNQELHEIRNTEFYLPRTSILVCADMPGASIPNWFEHQSWQLPISFWFRNKFIPIVLCLVIQRIVDGEVMKIIVRINGAKYEYKLGCYGKFHFYLLKDHICLLNLEDKMFKDPLDKDLLENEWKHAYVEFEPENFVKDIGIHVTKTEHIRFTDPFRRRKLEDDPKPQNQPLMKKS